MMKRCELCKSVANIHCDSDQASLCWNCDANVHSANFLVARHSRTLLCYSCQSLTQWSASGQKLEPSTVSICDGCVFNGTVDDDVDDDESSTEDGDEEEYDGDEDEIDLDDNQAVPWSSTHPPPASSSSSSKEFAISDGCVSMNRRNDADLSFEDDLNSSSVQKNHRNQSSAVAETTVGAHEAAPLHSLPSRSKTTMEELNKNRKRNMIFENESASETVGGSSKATRAIGFDLNSSD